MSQGAKKVEGPLTTAAHEFERELERYERIASELARTEVSSEKTLARTKKLLAESTECEETLGQLLGGLLQAMNGSRETQQRAMEMALGSAKRMQTRAVELNALLERFNALGLQAREVSAPVAAVIELQASGESADRILPQLSEISSRMEKVIADADSIASAAKDGNWPDLVREASTLRDQVQSARARVLRAQRDVAEQAPS